MRLGGLEGDRLFCSVFRKPSPSENPSLRMTSNSGFIERDEYLSELFPSSHHESRHDPRSLRPFVRSSLQSIVEDCPFIPSPDG